MPQEMNVLCCYSCKMYQVHIVKKARKWQCKLCNEKQSVRQVYFQGSGKDCRHYVQQQNYLNVNETPLACTVSEQHGNWSNYDTSASVSQKSDDDSIVKDKWTNYLDSPKKESLSDVEDFTFEDIAEIEDTLSNKETSNEYNDTENNSPNIKDIVGDSDLKTLSENVTDNHKTKELHSINSNIDKYNLQNDDKSSNQYDDATNIFETYEEFDDPLDF